MNALDILLKVFSSFLMILVIINIWKNYNEKNLILNKQIVSVIMFIIFSMINYYLVNKNIRIVIITFFLVFLYKFIFGEKIKKSVVIPAITQLIFMISEMIFISILFLIFNYGTEKIIETQFGSLGANISITFIAYFLSKIKYIKNIIRYVELKIDKLNSNFLFVIFTTALIFINIVVMSLYFKLSFGYLLIINSFLTIFYVCIIIYSFKAQNNYIEISEKYNITLNSLQEYENIIDKYRVLNHENKNQLLTIRNMISKKDKKIIDYIDSTISYKSSDNEDLLYKVSVIPQGGLRGLIYAKLQQIKDKHIPFNLYFSKNLKTFELIENIDNITMLNLCQIVGVFLDNAIEEVEKIDKQLIIIEIYLEEKDLVISISNTFESIDLSIIDIRGFSTKGNCRGYGLSLVKEIISKNQRLKNEKTVTDGLFTQKLKIKM